MKAREIDTNCHNPQNAVYLGGQGSESGVARVSIGAGMSKSKVSKGRAFLIGGFVVLAFALVFTSMRRVATGEWFTILRASRCGLVLAAFLP